MSNQQAPTPHDTALTTSDLPAAGGRLGPEPEDFVVEELPAFVPSGEGDHWWVLIRKRLWTTPDAIRAVARAAGVDQRDVGSAGMKDKHAVTTQWLSAPPGARPPSEWLLPDGLGVVEATRHRQKLRTGVLRGNRFRLRLVELEPGGHERALAIAERLGQSGLFNYFGAQRFGRGRNNLGEALDWLERDAPNAGSQTRFFRKFFPSVVQSEIYNRYLTLRRALGFDSLLVGEVMRLAPSRSVFLVEDSAREHPRWLAREIVPTGPIWGPKMKTPVGKPRELELQSLEGLGWTEGLERTLARLADGTRRDLVVWPENLEVVPLGEHALELRFDLPAGSYATQVLAEFTHHASPTPTDRPRDQSQEV